LKKRPASALSEKADKSSILTLPLPAFSDLIAVADKRHSSVAYKDGFL
jgi:hypothetical protein